MIEALTSRCNKAGLKTDPLSATESFTMKVAFVLTPHKKINKRNCQGKKEKER